LLHVIRSHFRLPIEVLVRRLGELEQAIGESDTPPPSTSLPKPTPSLTTATIQIQNSSNTIVPTKSSALPSNSTEKKPDPLLFPSSTTFVQTSHQIVPNNPISEDPTPSQADLGLSKTTQPYKTQKPLETKQLNTNNHIPTHQYDTLFQFAMVELEGQLQRKA
jgi:DNA polymerase-3 subunit gamma/tau